MTHQPPNAETYKTQLPEIIDLFTLDISLFLPKDSTDVKIYNFANWSQVNGANVVYKGVSYTPMPLTSSGFELNTKGQLARPTLTFANVGFGITSLTNTYQDLVGATISRIRTLTTYLDGEPNADPNAFWGPDEWVIEQKTNEDKLAVSFQLTVPFDLEGRSLPGRRLLREQCQWIYKGDIGCNYQGSASFDVNDEATIAEKDACGKRLTSCKLRFGNTSRLPFGGFPGLTDSMG